MKRGIYLAAALVIIVVGWRLLAVGSKRAATTDRVRTGEVTHGSLVVTLPVTGTLESAQETPVRTEIEGNLIELCEDNSPVKPGDVVYRLDTKELETQREDLVTALTDAQDALEQTVADSQTGVAQAESDALAARESLKVAQEKARAEREKITAQVKFAEGETARAQRELQRSQRLAKLNYIAGTKLRDAEKMYRAQEFVLEQQYVQRADVDKRTGEQVQDQQTALDLALHALETAKVRAQEDAENDRISVAEAQRRLDEVDRKIAQCTAVSPAAGLAVIETNTENWPERRPYRLGDGVGSGAAPVRVYDFTRMQVRCQIGEMDISRVHQGQDAFVLSSAGGGRRYRGKVAVVEELAQESNVWQGGTPGKKVFGLLITLSEADPGRLRPGMTVDLEIVLDSVREAMMAPIRAVFKDGGKSVVYRARGESFERVPVTAGTRNDLQMEVRGGLRVGDRVALERPPIQPAKRGEARQ